MRKVGMYKYKYTRFFIFAVFTVFAALAIATHPAQALDPRCDPDIRDIQTNHAQFRQIVDQAVAQELTKQNDSVEAMTCLDQQLIQSAQAGQIFSDTMPASFPAGFNGIISIGLNLLGVDTGTNPGFRGTTLLEDFQNVIVSSGVLGELMSMFSDAVTGMLSDLFGGLVGGLLGGLLAGWAGGLLSNWFGGAGLGGQVYDCKTMMDGWDNSTGGLTDPNAYPVVRTGPKGGIGGNYRRAYPSEMDILTGAIPGLPTPAACGVTPRPPLCAYVQKFYQTGPNAAILGNVLNDLTTRLVPGGIPAYKTAPPLTLNTTLGAVLGAM